MGIVMDAGYIEPLCPYHDMVYTCMYNSIDIN